MKDNHKPNHRCLACGIEYYACDSCDKKIDKTWRTACCTEGHYKAYFAMWQYGQGLLTREEVQAVLTEQEALTWENAPGKALIREIMDVDETEEPAGEPEPEAEQVPEETDTETAPNTDGFRERKKKRR